ncbi:hypothetical protein [Streptosporangium vulgare]|uniref:hypothetical protein n=1 Tax=Streptosporangium vulgare TaxID=46190 RepID=UPI003CD0881C
MQPVPLALADQRTQVGVRRHRVAQAQRLDPPGHGLQVAVGDLADDDVPAGADARLPLELQ